MRIAERSADDTDMESSAFPELAKERDMLRFAAPRATG